MTSSRDSLAQALNYIVNVEAVVRRGSQYLLIRRSPIEEVAPGLLSFPGGKLEEPAPLADVLEDTVRRELFEETGIKVSSVLYAGSKIFITDCGRRVLNIVFACIHAHGHGQVGSAAELTEVLWLEETELRGLGELPPWAMDTFERALKVFPD